MSWISVYIFYDFFVQKHEFDIITDFESLHKKKQFDWTLRGHDP